MTEDPGQNGPLLQALRERLAVEELHVVLPLSASAFDEVVVRTGGRPAGELVEGAAGVVLIGDGGPGFFARFRDTAPYASGVDHPLDDFTRGCVTAAVSDVLMPLGLEFRVSFPFGGSGARPPLPFQRLGRAAGLPEPGPLGLQIHPEFGPWWAYRALVVLPASLDAESPLLPWCPPCDRPCVRGCPTHRSVAGHPSLVDGGPVRDQVLGHVLGDVCGDDCGARLRCPVGREHAYPPDQIAFHLRAREALLRAMREA
jgi:hypothetical protein